MVRHPGCKPSAPWALEVHSFSLHQFGSVAGPRSGRVEHPVAPRRAAPTDAHSAPAGRAQRVNPGVRWFKPIPIHHWHVAQWQSVRLLSGRMQVRDLPCQPSLGGLAQLVEHPPCKRTVRGSTPRSSTRSGMPASAELLDSGLALIAVGNDRKGVQRCTSPSHRARSSQASPVS